MSNNLIDKIKPEAVRKHFQKITELPHNSGKEDGLRKYIADTARQIPGVMEVWYKPEAKSPGERVMVYKKLAAKGMEDKEPVVLQAHLDMVCVPNDRIFPLRLLECNEKGEPGAGWMKAGGYDQETGTTLGADDGIGVAVALAVLEDQVNKLGPVEVFFTVEEEKGMKGAREYDPTQVILKGRNYLNLDSEDLEIITCGSAGGDQTSYERLYKLGNLKDSLECYRIKLDNLEGGHSGVDIHRKGGNAIKLLARLLNRVHRENICPYLIDIKSGQQGNVIPREANAIIAVEKTEVIKLLAAIEDEAAKIRAEFKKTDPKLKMACNACFGEKNYMFNPEELKTLVAFLNEVPHGVIKWVQEPDQVQTSTNLAQIWGEGKDDYQLKILCYHRSLDPKTLDDLMNKHQEIGRKYGFGVIQDSKANRYPAWDEPEDSKLLKKAWQVYQEQYGARAEKEKVHAGLECSWAVQKYPKPAQMKCISIGPTIKEPHGYKERLELQSVEKFYNSLIVILKSIWE